MKWMPAALRAVWSRRFCHSRFWRPAATPVVERRINDKCMGCSVGSRVVLARNSPSGQVSASALSAESRKHVSTRRRLA